MVFCWCKPMATRWKATDDGAAAVRGHGLARRACAIRQGLPQALRAEAARLYWQAFGGKLGRVLGPDFQALAFLNRVIREDHCFVALAPSGDLLGLAGFKSLEGNFAGGGMADMRAVYGWWGSQWRAAALWWLSREVDNDSFLIDGICVAAPARGAGVGSALVAALCAEAQARGYPSIRLDVVDTNHRARALYERLGFSATRAQTLGPLRHLFGFSTAITMVRPLAG